MVGPRIEFTFDTIGDQDDFDLLSFSSDPAGRNIRVEIGHDVASKPVVAMTLETANLEDVDLKDAALLILHVIREPWSEIRVDDLPTGILKKYAIWVGRSLWTIGHHKSLLNKQERHWLRLEMLVPNGESLWRCVATNVRFEDGERFASALVSWMETLSNGPTNERL